VSLFATGVLTCGVLACEGQGEDSASISLLVQRSGGELGDAEVHGWFAHLTAHECLVFTSEPDGGGERYPVIWPKGSKPSEDGDELIGVEVPEFGLVDVGTYVSGGGRFERSGGGDGILPAVAPECLGETAEDVPLPVEVRW
jgi:hypothetical protein